MSTLKVSTLADLAGTSHFEKSLTTYGYQKLPGGLIMQWGYVSNFSPGRVTIKTITFPIEFPTACLNINMTTKREGDTDGMDILGAISSGPTTTQVVFSMRNDVDTSYYWFAVGY